MAERHFMVQLEERLQADTSGELRQSLARQLEALRDDLILKRRQIQPRETYRELQAALAVTNAALSVLGTLPARRAPS